MSPAPIAFLPVDSTRIAYHHTPASGDTGVLFLGGFMSDMQGSKATALEAFCAQHALAFTRMDYGGHGQSEGRFDEGTIGLWRDHALAVFDHIASKKMIIVGSSMGGWMMLLLALARPEKVAGLVGIAAAPDFTETLMWQQFSAEQQQEMHNNGRIMLPNCMPGESDYPITQELIVEGRNHLLLHKEIPVTCPTHLIHGMQDPDVPWKVSLELAEKMQRKDVTLSLIKNGDHRMSTPDNLTFICQAVLHMHQSA
ncbi:MAG: alpha/beta hydrolase [Alphaproteobacteria bacterium]|nr:alpha/beta hydrolase [Alphaproteobacteria bacterium]